MSAKLKSPPGISDKIEDFCSSDDNDSASQDTEDIFKTQNFEINISYESQNDNDYTEEDCEHRAAEYSQLSQKNYGGEDPEHFRLVAAILDTQSFQTVDELKQRIIALRHVPVTTFVPPTEIKLSRLKTNRLRGFGSSNQDQKEDFSKSSIFNKPASHEIPVDQIPQAIREKCQTQGFVDAKEVNQIMCRVKSEFEDNFVLKDHALTQAEDEEAEKKFSGDEDDDLLLKDIALTQMEQEEMKKINGGSLIEANTNEIDLSLEENNREPFRMEDFSPPDKKKDHCMNFLNVSDVLVIQNIEKSIRSLNNDTIKQKCRPGKEVTSVVQAIDEDFSDIENTNLSVVVGDQELDTSLNELSRILIGSQKGTEFLENASQLESSKSYNEHGRSAISKIRARNEKPCCSKTLLPIIEKSSGFISFGTTGNSSDDKREFLRNDCKSNEEIYLEMLKSDQKIGPELGNISTAKDSVLTTPKGPQQGFGFASGKKVQISESTFKSFQSRYAKVDQKISSELAKASYEEDSVPTTPKGPQQGFGFASGKKVQISESTFKSFQSRYAKADQKISSELAKTSLDEDSVLTTPKGPQQGFGFASGKKVQISESTFKSFQSRYAKADQKISSELANTSLDEDSVLTTPKAPMRSKSIKNEPVDKILPEIFNNDFSLKTFNLKRRLSESAKSPMNASQMANNSLNNSASGEENELSVIPSPVLVKLPSNPIFPTNRQPEKLRKNVAYTRCSSPKTPDSSISQQFPIHKRVKTFCTSKEIGNQNIYRKRSHDNSEKVATPLNNRDVNRIKIEAGISPISPGFESMKRGISKHSTPLTSKSNEVKCTMTDSQEISAIHQICANLDEAMEVFGDVSQPLSSKRKNNDFCKMPKPKFRKRLNIQSDSESDIEKDPVPFRLMTDVRNGRMRASHDQVLSIKDKSDDEKKAMAGTLYMMKANKNRYSILNYAKGAKPKFLGRHKITNDKAIFFTFNMKHYISSNECRTNINGLIIGDNCRVILSDEATLGFGDIRMAFIASPGVDPKLASDLWLENTYQHIVMKYVWLENHFEAFRRFELLSPDNVLLQMKYRYDREIDRHQRSAIRKICETDDVPYRRMVLRVEEVIYHKETGYELMVDDGWYKIRTIIDPVLADAVSKGKIIVGTKLITSGAELIGCDGCHPLELPERARLRMHGNSTRRIGWEAKLGYWKVSTPLPISLNSVLANGGKIGTLKLLVTHTFPMIYMETNGDQKVVRSEKLYERLQNQQEILSSVLFDQITAQVQREMQREVKERVKILKRTTFVVRDLSAEDLCDLLEFEDDSDELCNIQNQMSHKQREQVITERASRIHEMNDRIRKAFGDGSAKVTRMLKFRVVDASDPKKTAMITWWNPDESLLDIIKERNFIELRNTIVSSLINEEIQIACGKSSIVRQFKKKNTQMERFGNFLRYETAIGLISKNFAPPHNEFDVACVVVQIRPNTERKFEQVFVADEAKNIMSINFWTTVREYAYDDILKPGAIVYAKNLQWRATCLNSKIIESFVHCENTMFISNTKCGTHRRRLNQFENAIKAFGVNTFVHQCNGKIAAILGDRINKENATTIKKEQLNRPVDRPLTSISNNQKKSAQSSVELSSTVSKRPQRNVQQQKVSPEIEEYIKKNAKIIKQQLETRSPRPNVSLRSKTGNRLEPYEKKKTESVPVMLSPVPEPKILKIPTNSKDQSKQLTSYQLAMQRGNNRRR